MNSNFIAYNWKSGAKTSYFQAAANCQSAGRILAYFLNEIRRKYNFSPEKFTCVGHSLGAQVCAYAGKYSQEAFGWKFGRITGKYLHRVNREKNIFKS